MARRLVRVRVARLVDPMKVVTEPRRKDLPREERKRWTRGAKGDARHSAAYFSVAIL